VFYKPVTRLFILSIATSTTPHQWKRAAIMPVPKTSAPKEHADFRPISITPILTRILERIIVNQFIYTAVYLLSRFADDTYIIVAAVNASSRQAELSNGEAWARANNLKVNPAKYSNVVFFD